MLCVDNISTEEVLVANQYIGDSESYFLNCALELVSMVERVYIVAVVVD